MSDSAVVVWVGMLVIIIIATIVLGLLAHGQMERELRFRDGPSTSELDADARIAFESAERAELSARSATDQLARAEADRDAAWEEHTVATEQLEKALAELPDASPTELSEVAKAAREAYRRGDLSLEELRAVWQRIDDWDKVTHERTQHLSQLRHKKALAWRRYRLAALTASSMRRAADVAQVRANALAQEATDAADDAAQARSQRGLDA